MIGTLEFLVADDAFTEEALSPSPLTTAPIDTDISKATVRMKAALIMDTSDTTRSLVDGVSKFFFDRKKFQAAENKEMM